MFYIFVLGSQTSLLESLETDESNFKEKILHLLTDEPKQDKVNKIQKFRLNIDEVVQLQLPLMTELRYLLLVVVSMPVYVGPRA